MIAATATIRKGLAPVYPAIQAVRVSEGRLRGQMGIPGCEGPPTGESAEPQVKEQSTANLYGLLQGSDDITAGDIDAVKIKLKETA